MPIRESSFRIGCGRYLQEAGLLAKIGEEVDRLGSAPLIVGGKTALSLTRDKLTGALANRKFEIVEHTGTCNDRDAEALSKLAKEKGYDVIVGVGGGVIMDFAKLIAFYANRPLINVPTSTATCGLKS